MSYVQRNPPTYEAVQFNKEGDHPLVKRGYYNRSSHLIQSDALPRSPECRFSWVLTGPHNFDAVKIGDWIVENSKNPRLRVMSDADFQKEFVEDCGVGDIFQ